MNKLYDMFLGNSSLEEGTDLEYIAKLSPEEINAFDSLVTKSRGLPYYPLSQTIRNQRVLQFKYPRGDVPKPEVTRPDSYQKSDETPRSVPQRYSDEVEIGEGGTAVVFRALDNRLKRPVALKRFKVDENSSNSQDYLAELESVSRVRHPNVVSTFDANVDEKGSFIVMELIDGIDLQEAVEKERFGINRFVDFAIQALEGLLATHDGGLLHLDLKPSNIMISYQASGRSTVKLVDYGRARVIEDEAGRRPVGLGMNGSIYFAAPEQLLSQELDRRTDLYGLGCVFYWTLAQERPFEGDGTLEVMASHIQNTVTPLCEVETSVPDWLSDWVMSLLRCEKEVRPSTAQEAIDSLIAGARQCDVVRYTTS